MGTNKIFTEGRTLSQAAGCGPMKADEVFRLMEPAVAAAAAFHQSGGYYGEIGPDSIVLYDRIWLCHTLPSRTSIPGSQGRAEKSPAEKRRPAHTVSLLRRIRPKDGSETFCMPVEEYLGGDMIGPWSDVYSICAVIYALLTGQRPAEAKKRMRGEKLKPPSYLGAAIGAGREQALMKGLEIIQKDRWQNCRELYQALYAPAEGPEDPGKAKRAEEKGRVQEAGEKKMAPKKAEAYSAPAQTGQPEKAKRNPNVLMRQRADSHMLGTSIWCSEILSVTFLNTLAGKPGQYWDVSERQDGGVLAWAREQKNGYDFYIAGKGGVAGNPDSSRLFKDCYRMKEVRFRNCFDTSRVTDMSGMFDGCVSLNDLDISSFDTAAVTSTINMFYGCSGLARLDARGFCIKNVKNKTGMFTGCRSLKKPAVYGIDLDTVK